MGSPQASLAEEFPEMGFTAPTPEQASPITLHLHVDNADAMIKAAVEAGASEERAPEDQFYGERGGTIRDPFGYRWQIGHSIEDVAVEEMQSRYEKLFESDA